MYLSRLTLNPASADARRDLADAYELHRTLARVFADEPGTAPPRFLWRLDRHATMAGGHVLLVQAEGPGRWQRLHALPGYLRVAETDKPVDLLRLVGDRRRYLFRLRANPAIKRDGKRWGLHEESAQLAWLERHAQRAGFVLRGADVSQRQRIQVPHGEHGRRIMLDTVLFDGALEVTDAAQLRAALCQGIGPGKALGLGMLSLAPER